MKKWKTIALSTMLACLAIVASGTLAYFTAQETAHNVITSGGVDIRLIEKADTGSGLVDFKDVDGVMPGVTVSKIVQVENTGVSEAWVRVSLVKAFKLVDPAPGFQADPELLVLNIDTKNWTEKGGYYYYNTALAPGEITEPLFTTVTFDPKMGNEYQNSKASIDVAAQAVQTANNGDSALTAAGWPAATQH